MLLIKLNTAFHGTEFLGIAPCNIICLELKLTRHTCARGIFPLNTVFETHLFIFVFNELENWSRASRYHRHYISSLPTINGTIWDEKIPLNNDVYYNCVFAGCITIGVIPLRGLVLIVMIIGVVKWIAYLQFLTPIKVS